MIRKFHFQPSRLIAALLALVCLLGLLPTASFAAASNTIKMIDCDLSGGTYESAALGTCHTHPMHARFVP